MLPEVNETKSNFVSVGHSISIHSASAQELNLLEKSLTTCIITDKICGVIWRIFYFQSNI